MASANAIKEVAMMKKTIAAATIALTLAGAGLALAQQNSQQSPMREGRGFRQSAEDVAAFTDARVAALKAGLKLSAEQEKNWPAVETAIRDLAKERADRMKQREARGEARREARREGRRGGDNARQDGPDAISRLRLGADAMTTRAANLKKLADASEPLYKSLDEGQKHRFTMLLRMGGRHGGPGHHWERRADNAR
jgi:zinc resistance-associated protein